MSKMMSRGGFLIGLQGLGYSRKIREKCIRAMGKRKMVGVNTAMEIVIRVMSDIRQEEIKVEGKPDRFGPVPVPRVKLFGPRKALK